MTTPPPKKKVELVFGMGLFKTVCQSVYYNKYIIIIYLKLKLITFFFCKQYKVY